MHEAYLSLVQFRHAGFRDRAHFLAMASRAMRRLLVDHARRRGAQTRGGGEAAVELDEALPIAGIADERGVELDPAITPLESLEPRRAQVLEQHYFGRLPLNAIASSLGISVSSVKHDLRMARAWLAAELPSCGTAVTHRTGWADARPQTLAACGGAF